MQEDKAGYGRCAKRRRINIENRKPSCPRTSERCGSTKTKAICSTAHSQPLGSRGTTQKTGARSFCGTWDLASVNRGSDRHHSVSSKPSVRLPVLPCSHCPRPTRELTYTQQKTTMRDTAGNAAPAERPRPKHVPTQAQQTLLRLGAHCAGAAAAAPPGVAVAAPSPAAAPSPSGRACSMDCIVSRPDVLRDIVSGIPVLPSGSMFSMDMPDISLDPGPPCKSCTTTHLRLTCT